jgi:hypothetical protein
MFLGGLAVTAARAYRAAPAIAAGPMAGVLVWLVHSAVDWDWEMPALSLVALVLAGLLLAAGDVAPRMREGERAAEAPELVAA